MKKVFVTRNIPENGLNMLREIGYEVDVSPHDRPLTRDEMKSFLSAKPYDGVLSLLTDKIDREIYDVVPSAKIFANFAIGFDNFDVEEGKRRGIYLTNTPHGGVDRVAEHAWGLILALTCNVVAGDKFVKDGKYTGWNPMLFQGFEITGKTLGLIGAGRIGTEVARIGALGFGMRVAYYDIARNPKIENIHGATYWHTPEEVIKQADIVSLHVPLLDSTRHLINMDRLKMMKKTAYLINTARGPVVDENALVQALKEGIIAGAGLDVFEHEPELAPGLRDLPNVVLTPHIASATTESREEMAQIAAVNIIDALEGVQPRDLVYNK